MTENPSVPDFKSLAETFGGILERLVPQGRAAEIEEALRFRQVGGLQRLGFFALRDALAAAPYTSGIPCCDSNSNSNNDSNNEMILMMPSGFSDGDREPKAEAIEVVELTSSPALRFRSVSPSLSLLFLRMNR